MDLKLLYLYWTATLMLLFGVFGSVFEIISDEIGITLVIPAMCILGYEQWKGRCR